MTCLEGSFHYPSIPTQDNSSLAEVLLRADGKGSVANWTPTGYGVVYGHDYLNRGLYEAIFVDDIYELGAAVTQAKLFLYTNTAEYRDMLDTYAFFGDPAMDLHQYYVNNFPLIFK
jgi:hypothetical protein